MEEDVLASSLIPEDSGFDEPQKAVKATGNNNCSLAQCPAPPFARYVTVIEETSPISKLKVGTNQRSYIFCADIV